MNIVYVLTNFIFVIYYFDNNEERMDQANKGTLSRMMSSVRSKNVMPEAILRKAIFSRSYNPKSPPGKPNIVLPKFHTTICVHGCLWQQCEHSALKPPLTRLRRWKEKLDSNKNREKMNSNALKSQDRKIQIVLKSTTEKRKKQEKARKFKIIFNNVESFLTSNRERPSILKSLSLKART